MRMFQICDGRDDDQIDMDQTKRHLFFGTIVLLEGGYLHTRFSISSKGVSSINLMHSLHILY